MPLKNYGVLKGRPIARRLGSEVGDLYQVHLVDDDADYRIAVNVMPKTPSSDLLYLILEDYAHPLVDNLKELPAGFTSLKSQAGGLALDYVRGKLFKPSQMVRLPYGAASSENILQHAIDGHVQRAIAGEDAMIYAFGERKGPEPGLRDRYFGFMPSDGIHDIHMNQGNSVDFRQENGTWQDGGLLICYPAKNRWIAVFPAFQSQCWRTDDQTGNCIVD